MLSLIATLALIPPQAPASTSVPTPAQVEPIGFFVLAPGSKNRQFIEWKSEETLNKFLSGIRHQKGYGIQFTPGVYEVSQRIIVSENPGLTISGSAGVTLQFAEGMDDCGNTSTPIEEGTTEFDTTHPELFLPLKRYQLFRADSKGDRLLEFVALSVDGNTVKMAWAAHFMPHVKSIPAGARIIEDVNFFAIYRSPGLTIQNLIMDGRGQGNIRGHTTYCGVYAVGNYELHRKPITDGLTIRGCTFKGLSGRGVAFYGIYNAVIQSCTFQNIRAQAIEVDHYSSGLIQGNHVDGAEVGVMINDAFDSLIEANTLVNCREAVKFLRIHEDDWTNTGNTVQFNHIGPGCRAGVRFFGPGMHDNLVRGNFFYGLGDDYQVMNAEGNQVNPPPSTPVKD